MVIFCGKILLFHENWDSSDWEGAAVLSFEFVRVVHEGTEEDVTLQKVIRKLSGGVESLLTNTELFPYSTCLGTNQLWECVKFNFVFLK